MPFLWLHPVLLPLRARVDDPRADTCPASISAWKTPPSRSPMDWRNAAAAIPRNSSEAVPWMVPGFGVIASTSDFGTTIPWKPLSPFLWPTVMRLSRTLSIKSFNPIFLRRPACSSVSQCVSSSTAMAPLKPQSCCETSLSALCRHWRAAQHGGFGRMAAFASLGHVLL